MLILQGMGDGWELMTFQEKKNAFRAACRWRFHGEATGNLKGLSCNSDNKLRGKVVDLGIRGTGLALVGWGGDMCAQIYIYTQRVATQ